MYFARTCAVRISPWISKVREEEVDGQDSLLQRFPAGNGQIASDGQHSHLARGGRQRVGIVDLDDSAPTQYLIFGLPEVALTFTLADSLAGRCRVAQAAYEVTPPAVQGAGGGIFLAPLNIEPEWTPRSLRKGMNLERIGDILRDLIQALALDYLLTDSGSGINELSLNAIGDT